MRFGHKIIIVMAALLLFAVGLYAYEKTKRDFVATGETGPWSFQADAKDLNLLYMGFTQCPDMCPMTLTLVAQAFSELSADELKRVRFIFLDVDYARDTGNIAALYAKQFNPNFVGILGNKEQLDTIVKFTGGRYAVNPDPQYPGHFVVFHANRLFFLNKRGIVKNSLGNPDAKDSILKMIKDTL